jgi:hypothetical protein
MAMAMAPATLGLSVLEKWSEVARTASYSGEETANLVVEGSRSVGVSVWGGQGVCLVCRGEGRRVVVVQRVEK